MVTMTTVNHNPKPCPVELTAAELVQIDSLVKQGLYQSREDYLQQARDKSAAHDHAPAEWGGAPVYLSLRMH